MRVGNFSLLVPQGRERDSGHVEVPNGAVYHLRLGNHDHRRCDAEVSIDGKPVGTFRLDAHRVLLLERPAHDQGCFTFFEAGSAEGQASGAAKITGSDRGLVQVTFRPERAHVPPPVYTSHGPVYRGAGGGHGSFGEIQSRCAEEKTAGGINLQALSRNQAGVTGLTGQSAQHFHTVATLDHDPLAAVTISLRLVSGPAVRELAPATTGNAVPAPVG